MEEDEQWKQLKAPGEHVEHQHVFGEHAEESEVLGWSGKFKSGTDVVDGCGNRREIGHQIISLKLDQKKRDDKYYSKGYKVYVD